MDATTHIESEVINVLNYFNYFKFPLTLEEMHHFIRVEIDKNSLTKIADKLVENNSIYKIDGCYLISNSPELVRRKKLGLTLANKRMKRAQTISNIINWFPFVRMVAISGSLSKNYADKGTDIDFFIVTTQNNLWTSRTLLHLFKKLTFLVNLQHSFCMNYFIAEEHLKLEEKNYFTAIELSTLIPTKGKYNYNQLLQANKWIEDYLPNFNQEKITTNFKNSKGIKWVLEKLLSSSKLNKYLMNLTDKKWRKKWEKRGFPAEEYELAFRTTLFESKNHPGNNQKKVLEHMNSKK